MIKLTSLIPTQSGLRDDRLTKRMTEFVDAGGIFDYQSLISYNQANKTNRGSSLITLNQFEDGAIYIQDGHHRVVGIYLDHRDFLYPEEYRLENWTYAQYAELTVNSISVGWLTPFNPLIEVRHPEFHNYKQSVPTDPNEALEYIKRAWEKGVYCSRRNQVNCWTIKDLIK